MVIAFLEALGLHATPNAPIRLPADFLLSLAGAMRILRWQLAGLSHQLHPCLPSPSEVIVRAAKQAKRGQRMTGAQLWRRLVTVGVNRLAWRGLPDLGADVVLDLPDENTLVEAIAQFFWEHRHGSPAPVGG